MSKSKQKIEIVMSEEEYKYLKGLIESEVFQLSGIVRIKKSVPERKDLSIAEKLQNQLSNPKLVAA